MLLFLVAKLMGVGTSSVNESPASTIRSIFAILNICSGVSTISNNVYAICYPSYCIVGGVMNTRSLLFSSNQHAEN